MLQMGSISAGGAPKEDQVVEGCVQDEPSDVTSTV